MIAHVVKRALGRAIDALPPGALGVRCHVFPIDDRLEECLEGIAALFSESGYQAARCIIGSTKTTGTNALPPRTVVLPSDLAAAEATRIRNDAAEAGVGGFKLIYLNAGSTPGEAGLTDVLVEIRAQALARHFAETAGLSLLAAAASCKARPIVARLEDTTVEALASFDAIARATGEKSALPTLGFLPRSLAEDDGERPNAQWVSDFDTIKSGRFIEPLAEGIHALKALNLTDRARLTRALLETPGLLPESVRRGRDLIAGLIELGDAVRRFSLGQDMDSKNLCGLSRRLLDLLRSPEKLAELASNGDQREVQQEEVETDVSGEEETPQPCEALREEELLSRIGADALRGLLERFEYEDGAFDISLRSTRRELINLETDLPHPVTAITVKDAAVEVADGTCFAVTPESAILAGSRSVNFAARYDRGRGTPASGPLLTAINAFCGRRADLLRAVEGLLPEEEATKFTPTQRALLALEVIPLTCIANVPDAAEAYVAAYVALMQLAFEEALDDATEKWLTHVDLAVSLDPQGGTVAARLQPLHPLRVARSQLWLSSRSEPPLFPPSVVTLTGFAPIALYPQGERYCYHARPRSGPSRDGVEAAVGDGLNALWSLLAPKGLMAAVDVEFVDVVNSDTAVVALYRAAAERFAEDAGVGAGVHLRVRCAYSPARVPMGLDCPRLDELPELVHAVGTPPGSGVTLEVMPALVQSDADSVHLSVQAVEAPFHGLPPSDHVTGWNARYIPGQSGNVIAVELAGSPALDGYRRLLRHYGKDATATFDPGLAELGIGKALVKTFVAYGGWPVRPNPCSSLLSYDVIGRHVIATLIDGELFDAEVKRQLEEFSAGGAAAVGKLSDLRESILGLFPCRNFLANLVGGAAPTHTLGWLGILRAYREAERSAGGAQTLTLSLDSQEGRSWIKSVSTALGVDEGRADLLILEGRLEEGRLERIRVVELKARTSSRALGSRAARAKLARQALTTVARIRVALSGDDPRAAELRDGLRKFFWLGAGQQRAALHWRKVLEHLDTTLLQSAPVALPVTVECWLVPEEEWVGADDETEEVQALDAAGNRVSGESVTVRFRVLQAVSRLANGVELARSVEATRSQSEPAQAVSPPTRLDATPIEEARPTASSAPASVVPTPSGDHPELAPDVPTGQLTPGAEPVAPKGASLVDSASPPPRPPAPEGMKILFGRAAQGSSGDAFWLPNRTDLVTHFNVGIVGTMGSGKTQFTKSLLTQIVRAGRDNPGGRRPGLLVFDYKGDYVDKKEGGFAHAVGARVLPPHDLPINPLRLKRPDSSLDLKLSMRQFAETVRTIARATGDVQRQKIISAIESCLANAGIDLDDGSTWSRPFPTLKDLDEYVTQTNAVEGVPYSVIHDLADLRIFASEDPGVDLDSFFDEVTVIDLRPLAGADKTIAAVISFFMNAFFARMIQQGESHRENRTTELGGKVDLRQISRLLLVDEADDFIGLDLPSLKNVMQQGRAFGHGVILSTQFLHHFDSANSPLKPLVGTWVLHRMADVAPSALRNLFGLSTDEAKSLATTLNGLEVHHSVCQGLSNESFRRRLTRIRDLPFFELASQ